MIKNTKKKSIQTHGRLTSQHKYRKRYKIFLNNNITWMHQYLFIYNIHISLLCRNVCTQRTCNIVTAHHFVWSISIR